MATTMTCERTLTAEGGKVSYCRNKAFYVSPPGYHTGVIIKVCERCKQEMLDLSTNFYKEGGKTVQNYKSEDFQRIGTAPVSTVEGREIKK